MASYTERSPGGFGRVPVGLDADIHPLQGNLLFLGQTLYHVDGTSRDPGQKQFAGAYLLAAGIIRDEVMCAGIADGAAQVSPYCSFALYRPALSSPSDPPFRHRY